MFKIVMSINTETDKYILIQISVCYQLTLYTLITLLTYIWNGSDCYEDNGTTWK